MPNDEEVYKAIGRVASQNLPCLLLGESGTGKEVVAQATYHHSARSTGPFQGNQLRRDPDALLGISEISATKKGRSPTRHRTTHRHQTRTG